MTHYPSVMYSDSGKQYIIQKNYVKDEWMEEKRINCVQQCVCCAAYLL